jgi:hypothetical protein
MFADRIPFVGMAGGAKYIIGVRNPLTRRRPARLCQSHLLALDGLLSFAQVSHLEQQFSVAKHAYAKRFGSENGWVPLLELLDSWYRIRSSGYIVEGTVAETSITNNAGFTEVTVRIGAPLVVVFNLLLGQLRRQPGVPSTLAKTLVEDAFSGVKAANSGVDL